MEWKIDIENLATREAQALLIARDSIAFGRNTTNDVVIENALVSREHALFECQAGRCFIEDRGSANGTALQNNGHWEPLAGRQAVQPPFRLMLGKEITVAISTVVTEIGQTAIFGQSAAQSVVSHVLNIEEFAKEEALMVLDLCDSTQLAGRDQAMSFHLVKRLESVSMDSLRRFQVDFFKRTGDGFLASFPLTTHALDAASEIMRRLSERNRRTQNLPINARVALHHGKTYTVDPKTRDIHGNDVNLTFRIEGVQQDSFADGAPELPARDRILCSRVFYEDVVRREPARQDAFFLCGSARLKGIAEPVDIYCVRLR
ncbi:MAG: FHA domain-containing protein [Lentisphaerae bacterium]|nr:FHA domain-containing protein [Lentisphaerota bacterium]